MNAPDPFAPEAPMFVFTQADIPENRIWLEGLVREPGAEAPADAPDAVLELISHLADEVLAKDVASLEELFGTSPGPVQLMPPVAPFLRLFPLAAQVGAELGSGVCACALGAMYYSGDWLNQNYDEAVRWYEVAAERGNSQGMVNLGYCYSYGRGSLPKDQDKAFKLFAKAALLDGNPEALWKLGDAYRWGNGAEQDPRMALELYGQAYEKLEPGDSARARPAHHLAEMCLTGEGMDEPNPEAAFQLACEAELLYYREVAQGLEYYRPYIEQAKMLQEDARRLLTMSL